MRGPAREAIRFYYLPVPVRLEVCGLPGPLSLTDSVPDSVPVCVGENTTLIVQVDFEPRLDEQVVVETLKSPVVPIEMPVSATPCLLSSVNTLAALVDPTFVAGNVLLAGVNVTPAAPVPVSGTDCGLFGALSVMVMAPELVPT